MSNVLNRWNANDLRSFRQLLPRVCVLFIAFVAIEAVTFGAAPPSPEMVFSTCLAHRDAVVRSGYLRLMISSERNIGSEAVSEVADEMLIWFVGSQIRFDMRRRSERNTWHDDWEKFAVTESTYTWIPEGGFEGVIAPVSEYSHDPGGVMGHFHLFHPRWIGMGVNGESLMQHSIGARLVTPETKRKFTVESDDSGGDRLWRVTSALKYPAADAGGDSIAGLQVSWFDPNAGWNLVRGELQEFAPQGTKVLSVRCRVRRFGNDNHWFPEEVVREVRYAERITQRTTLTVLDADFDSVPDRASFSASGMSLAAGKRLADRTQGTREVELISDGKALIPISGPDVEIASSKTSTGRAWLLLLNALILAGLGFALLIRARRARLRADYN